MKRLVLLSFVVNLAAVAYADVSPNPLFVAHAVLQQEMRVPVWGTASPGEAVTVELAGQTVRAIAGGDGKWLVHLEPMRAGGPFTMRISGKNQVVLDDILIGEVWICSGQSNMERPLGLRAGQQPIVDWEKEVAAANHPQIRHFGVAQTKSLTPLETVKGQWQVCSPDTVKDFTAVGYFFGRDLHGAKNVPVGLIHSSWGGTPAEAWSSEASLRQVPELAPMAEQTKLFLADPAAAKREADEHLDRWFDANDLGSADGKSWSDPALDESGWEEMTLPTLWEQAGEPDLNGVVWFRRTFELPDSASKVTGQLLLGMVDDEDTTWVNGVRIGSTHGYNVVRKYSLPAGVLKPGRNVVAVRVLDTGGGGGIWGDDKPRVVLDGGPVIDLAGRWRYRIGKDSKDGPWPPLSVVGDVNTPTVLFNGMIAPLLPYGIRGVVWYQGESNVGRALQYRTLFPAMIAGWRKAWGQGDFPFLFVQIAPHNEMTPEIREAQLLSWQHTTNTAMAVTVDCGDAHDIHPAHKQPVGARLALAARAMAYGERVEYAGPVYDSMTIKRGKAVVRFTHVGGGLVAKGGALRGFAVAGSDKVFHPAEAVIRGDTVVVASKAVPQPVAIRYGWANVPDVNLFNKAGLPASPFRSHVGGLE